MNKLVIHACLAVGLALGASQVAMAQSSSPGSVGTGQTNPVTVPSSLQNAKPMPLPSAKPAPHVLLRSDSNRKTVRVKAGTIIDFKLDGFGPGWICTGGTIAGNSVALNNGVYTAVSPSVSTITFSCRPPAPKPGFAGSKLAIAYIVEIDVR